LSQSIPSSSAPSSADSNVGAVIVAAGKGLRLGKDIPKQFLKLGGVPILRRTVETFSNHPRIGPIVVVHGADQEDICREILAGIDGLLFTAGGANRRASVRNGLAELEHVATSDITALIHDAARPFVGWDVIDRVIDATEAHGAAIPAVPPVDSVKSSGPENTIAGSVDRDSLRMAQTPQGFRLGIICGAHDSASSDWDASDDAALVEAAGGTVHVVTGDIANEKITHDWQYQAAEARIAGNMEYRVGSGFDVHRLGHRDDGRQGVILCGVQIPHDRALIGHSDADVALHALTDALLGALGLGDIGDHFPPSDPQWKGADSETFLRHAVDLIRDAGGEIVNCDLTILCEKPKIAPHRAAMRERLAAVLSLSEDRVSVKATTTERLGFTGREEGIACQASTSIRVPR